MTTKKLATILLTALLSLVLVSCGKTNTPTKQNVTTTASGNVTTTTDSGGNEETFEDKWIDGIPAIFDESMGYSDENPSAFQVGATRYVYYTRNVSKNSSKTEIVVRNYKRRK